MGRYACAVGHCPEKSYRRSEGVQFYKLKHQPKSIQRIWRRRIMLTRSTVKRQSDLNDVCICSRHFHGGAKTKFHNIPTIFPKKCDDGDIVWPQNANTRRRSVVRRGLSKWSPLSVNNNNNNETSTSSGMLTLTEKLEYLKRKELTENNERKNRGEKSPKLSTKLASLQAKEDKEPDGVATSSVSGTKTKAANRLEELQRQLQEEKAKNKRLEQQLEIERFGLRRFMCSNEDFKFYTGLPDYFCFLAVFDFLNTDGKLHYWGSSCKGNAPSYVTPRGKERSLAAVDELFLTLNKLRQAYLEKDLAHRFHVSESTVFKV
ncbi:uncharacterized protein [Ptychodera flava]|uniref:uncharacterized protein n=1 Tax=Ptychodera flava TaxID=63121 RepID=UPI00396A8304